MNSSSEIPPSSTNSDVSNVQRNIIDSTSSVNRVPNTSGPSANEPASVASAPARADPEVKPGSMRSGEEARDHCPAIKPETKIDVKKSVSDVEQSSTVTNCGTGTVDGESTTAAPSVESAIDDADVTMDDADLSDGDQPGPAGVLRKPSAAPQIDAEQLRCDPDFAIICSFINKFFTLMKMEPVSFCQLENMFTTLEDGRVSKELVDLHLKLLRRSIVKTVSNESFEKCLLKYLNSTGLLSSEKRQLETYGYVHMSILSKLKILRTLCELQLDHNLRLRESIPTALRAMDMRDTVTGVDKNGLAYYCQIDSKYGLRLYTTEQDDESGYSWTLVARDMTDLENLIAKLKADDLGYVKNPNDKREFNKPAEGDAEPAINMVTKKGTFVDMFLDEAAIKKMRETMVKEKEERRTRRNARLENTSEPQEEVVPEEEEKPVEVEEGDRRVLPRRSASQKAQSNIRKYITPSRRTHEKKTNPTEQHEEVKDENAKRDSSSPASDDSEGSAGTSDAEVDGSATSDDEFKPKTPKKSTGKRRHRKKKVIDDVEDDDESADEDEEEVRRRAEGDFACGSCKLSDNEDILLLCDNCDDAWHTTCLKPPLWFVPGGKWYCPKCEHGMLIECLTYVQEVLVIHQKKAAAEEKKRKAAADRFRREMEYIGVSLNNIIPTTLKQAAVDSSSSSSSDDGQRRSKKKAVKRITPNVRRAPIHVQTVAEGRSRRSVKKVDYKFSEFDSVIKEACRMNESPPPPDTMNEVARPQGGAGRGKDMANIIEAQKQREDGTPRVSAGAPPRPLPKHRRRLNDLNFNDESDSDSDEYKANESEEEAAEEEAQSSSDYVPSEGELRKERSGGGGRMSLKPTQSDEDFVVSGSDDSYVGPRRKKRKVKEKRKKRGRWQSDSESEEEEEEEDETYSDDSRAAKKKGRKRAEPSSDETNDELDEVQMDEDEEDSDAPRTRTGRPLRKAVVKSKKTLLDDSEDEGESNENEETENGEPGEDKTAPEANKAKKRKAVSDSESDVFEPDEDAENDDEDDEEIEEDEETSRETAAPAAPAAPAKAKSPVVDTKADAEDDKEEYEDSDNDLDLKPKPKRAKIEEKSEDASSAKPHENNVVPAVESTPPLLEAKPKPIPSVPASTPAPKAAVEPVEEKPTVTEAAPPSSSPAVMHSPVAVVAPSAGVASSEEKPRVVADVRTPQPNPYTATTIATSVKPAPETPPSTPAAPRPQAPPQAASTAPSYAAGDRSSNISLTPLVPNPYANTSSLSQMPYRAGPQAAMPYAAVANPYMPYPSNTPPFPPGAPPVGHPHIGYIPGVVPNPYGQQPSMPPSKSGTRDLRTL